VGTNKRAAALYTGALSGLVNSGGSIVAVAVFGRDFIRSAGLEVFGAWSIIPFLAGLYSFADFGFARESMLRIAVSRDGTSRGRCVAALTVYAGLASFVVSCCGVGALAWGMAEQKGIGSEHSLVMAAAVVAAAFGLGALSVVRTLAEAQNRLAFVNYSLLLQTVLAYAFAVAAVRMAPGSAVVYLTYPCALWCVAACFAPIVWDARKGWGKLPSVSMTQMRETWCAAVGHGVAAVVSSAVLPLNRAYILHRPQSLAFYGAFEVLAKIAESSAGLLTSAFTPLYRHFLDPSTNAEKRRLLLLSERIIIGAFLLGSGLYVWFAKPALAYLLGREGVQLVSVSVAMVILRASHGIAEPATRLLWAVGNKSIVLQGRVTGFLLNILLLVALGPRVPLEWGAAIAYSAPFLAAGVLIAVKGRRLLDGDARMVREGVQV
jgi:O-antigen/teichoic acid export membrane protein